LGGGREREKHKEGRQDKQANFFNENGVVLYLAKGKRRFKVKSSHLFSSYPRANFFIHISMLTTTNVMSNLYMPTPSTFEV
jgi:hypothetical protein